MSQQQSSSGTGPQFTEPNYNRDPMDDLTAQMSKWAPATTLSDSSSPRQARLAQFATELISKFEGEVQAVHNRAGGYNFDAATYGDSFSSDIKTFATQQTDDEDTVTANMKGKYDAYVSLLSKFK